MYALGIALRDRYRQAAYCLSRLFLNSYTSRKENYDDGSITTPILTSNVARLSNIWHSSCRDDSPQTCPDPSPDSSDSFPQSLDHIFPSYPSKAQTSAPSLSLLSHEYRRIANLSWTSISLTCLIAPRLEVERVLTTILSLPPSIVPLSTPDKLITSKISGGLEKSRSGFRVTLSPPSSGIEEGTVDIRLVRPFPGDDDVTAEMVDRVESDFLWPMGEGLNAGVEGLLTGGTGVVLGLEIKAGDLSGAAVLLMESAGCATAVFVGVTSAEAPAIVDLAFTPGETYERATGS